MRKRLKQEADQPRQFGRATSWNWKKPSPGSKTTKEWRLRTLARSAISHANPAISAQDESSTPVVNPLPKGRVNSTVRATLAGANPTA
jgi:hypothetical protein